MTTHEQITAALLALEHLHSTLRRIHCGDMPEIQGVYAISRVMRACGGLEHDDLWLEAATEIAEHGDYWLALGGLVRGLEKADRHDLAQMVEDCNSMPSASAPLAQSGEFGFSATTSREVA